MRPAVIKPPFAPFVACVVLAALLIAPLAPRAFANADALLLITGGAPNPLLTDAARRIGAELALRAFVVFPDSGDVATNGACLTLAEGTERVGALGGLAMMLGTDARTVLLVSYDRRAGTCLSHSVALPSASDDASLVAVRAVEMLRAHFLELRFKEREQVKVAASQPVAAVPARDAVAAAHPNEAPSVWSVGAGAQALAWPRGAGIALQPVLDVARGNGDWSFGVRLAPLSNVMSDELGTSTANTSVRSLAVDGQRLFGRRKRLQPFVLAELGLAWIHFAGHAMPPDVAQTEDVLTPMAGAHMGLRMQIARSVFGAFSCGVQAWRSTPVLQLKTIEQRRFSNPLLLASLTLHWGGTK